MQQRILEPLATMLAGAVVLLAVAGTAVAQGNDVSEQSPFSANRLPVEEIAASLRAQGYTSISEIEAKGRWFKVEARDAQGGEVELYVDAESGELLQPGNRLGVEEITRLLRAMGYVEVLEIDPEGLRYEVETHDAEGREVSLEVDALTGEVLGVQYDDDDDD